MRYPFRVQNLLILFFGIGGLGIGIREQQSVRAVYVSVKRDYFSVCSVDVDVERGDFSVSTVYICY